MTSIARGAAFVDRSGVVLSADDGFRSHLGLPAAGDPTAALRARAEENPALRALLAGEGPSIARFEGASGELELERVDGGGSGGALLLVRGGELAEQALRSHAITRVASGLAHDIKNPLNAMALQLALLGEKLAVAGDGGVASEAHLGAIRDQIGRVNEVVRRFLDVADPSAPMGYTDLGAFTTDAGSLLGHEARRRRIELTVDAPAGASVGATGEPARVGRLVLTLFARLLARTPDSGKLSVRVANGGPSALVTFEGRGAGRRDLPIASDEELAVSAAAARALGGALEVEGDAAVDRVVLRLPRNEP